MEEDRNPGLEARTPLGPAGTGPQVEANRGEEWFEEWRRKDGYYKGEPTGVDRDVSDDNVSERGATRQGKRRQKQARSAEMQGTTGTWGAG